MTETLLTEGTQIAVGHANHVLPEPPVPALECSAIARNETGEDNVLHVTVIHDTSNSTRCAAEGMEVVPRQKQEQTLKNARVTSNPDESVWPQN